MRRVLFLMTVILAAAAAPSDARAQAQSGPQAQPEPQPQSEPQPQGLHRPPRPLYLRGDHWTPYSPPDEAGFPAGTKVHRIVKGDTLWDLAGSYMNDNYLWPKIWEANQYVLDSHWIYPGDPLVILPLPVVVPEVAQGAPAPEAAPAAALSDPSDLPPALPDESARALDSPIPVVPEVEAEPGEPGPDLAQAEPPPPAPTAPGPRPEPELLPPPSAIHEVDVECSEWIVRKFKKPDLRVQGLEDAHGVAPSVGDYLILNRGAEHGIEAGAEYVLVRPGAVVENPITGRNVGVDIRPRGRVRVVLVHPESATAEVLSACEEIEIGDFLIPYEPRQAPYVLHQDFNRLAYKPSGNKTGHIVLANDSTQIVRGEAVTGNISLVAAGTVVLIDLGARDGVQPGDWFTVLLDSPYGSKYPPQVLGEGVVIRTEERASTAKILSSDYDIPLGARVELK
jgi:hypothetical protein